MQYFIYSFLRRTNSALLYRLAFSQGFPTIAMARSHLTTKLKEQGLEPGYRFVFFEFPKDAAPSAVQVEV